MGATTHKRMVSSRARGPSTFTPHRRPNSLGRGRSCTPPARPCARPAPRGPRRLESPRHRRDAVELVLAAEKGRMPDLLPLRHGRMVRSRLHVLPRVGPHDGGRPGVHALDRDPRPVLRGRPPVQLRRLRHAGAADDLLHQRPRRDAAGAVGVGREAPGRELRRGVPGQRPERRRRQRRGHDLRPHATASRWPSSAR